jgi:hypothetical protein
LIIDIILDLQGAAQTIPEDHSVHPSTVEPENHETRASFDPLMRVFSSGFADVSKVLHQHIQTSAQQMERLFEQNSRLQKQNIALEKRFTRLALGSSKDTRANTRGAGSSTSKRRSSRPQNDLNDDDDDDDGDQDMQHIDPYWGDPDKINFMVLWCLSVMSRFSDTRGRSASASISRKC